MAEEAARLGARGILWNQPLGLERASGALASVIYSCATRLPVLSHVRLFVTLWAVAFRAPLSAGFSRQDYWRQLPFISPGDLPDPGIEPVSSESPALQADSLLLNYQGSPIYS